MFKVGLSTKIQFRGAEHASQVEDLDSEFLFLAAPIARGRVLFPRVGSTVTIYFIHKGAVYSFDAQVRDNLTEDSNPLIQVPRPEKLRKTQRRQFFRLEKQLPVQYKLLEDDLQTELSDIKSAYALDISGGGLRLATEEIIPVNTYLELTFILNIEESDKEEEKEVTCIGKIVHTKKIESNKLKIYHYGVKFVSLARDIQDLIVRFTFSEQRKLKRKGRMYNGKD